MQNLNYELIKANVHELNEKSKQAENLRADPHNYVYEYFLELRNQVELRRETFKEQIDEYSNQLIDDLKTYEEKCSSSTESIAEITAELKVTQLQIIKLAELLDSFSDEKGCSEIYQESERLDAKLNEQFSSLKHMLIGEESYFLCAAAESDLTKTYGCIKSRVKAFSGSSILNKRLSAELVKLCGFDSDVTWQLVYKGTQDGFSCQDFHSKCDRKAKTLVVIETSKSYVFGGYTEADWLRSVLNIDPSSYKTDPNAFIFSLKNHEREPLKMACLRPGKAIMCAENTGPIFGACDIKIAAFSNKNNKSFSNLGYNYKHPRHGYNSRESKMFLAGEENFQVVEIEVFTI